MALQMHPGARLSSSDSADSLPDADSSLGTRRSIAANSVSSALASSFFDLLPRPRAPGLGFSEPPGMLGLGVQMRYCSGRAGPGDPMPAAG